MAEKEFFFVAAENPSRKDNQDSADRPRKRRLPGPIRPRDRDDLAGVRLERDAFQYLVAAKPDAQVFKVRCAAISHCVVRGAGINYTHLRLVCEDVFVSS